MEVTDVNWRHGEYGRVVPYTNKITHKYDPKIVYGREGDFIHISSVAHHSFLLKGTKKGEEMTAQELIKLSQKDQKKKK